MKAIDVHWKVDLEKQKLMKLVMFMDNGNIRQYNTVCETIYISIAGHYQIFSVSEYSMTSIFRIWKSQREREIKKERKKVLEDKMNTGYCVVYLL